MRIRTIGLLAASAMALSSCGTTGGKAASLPRPPAPINLSVYVNDSRVLVSPNSAGAGPIVFVVTNQASQSEALAIAAAGGAKTLASTAPINPQGTTQVTVNIKPGTYTIGIASHGSTDAELSQQSSIAPASFHIGKQRANSSSQVLQP